MIFFIPVRLDKIANLAEGKRSPGTGLKAFLGMTISGSPPLKVADAQAVAKLLGHDKGAKQKSTIKYPIF